MRTSEVYKRCNIEMVIWEVPVKIVSIKQNARSFG